MSPSERGLLTAKQVEAVEDVGSAEWVASYLALERIGLESRRDFGVQVYRIIDFSLIISPTTMNLPYPWRWMVFEASAPDWSTH